MKIAYVASEMIPFAKTGGLAEVTGTLAHEVRRLGHEVIAFIPRYKMVDAQKLDLRVEIEHMEVPVGSERETVKVSSYTFKDGVQIYFIEHPEFYAREGLYGTPLGDYPDNDRRFILFQRAVLETLRAVDFRPDLIHCHDWQTGLIPVYLKTLYSQDQFFQKTRTVFTIHNLGYQGNFPPDSLPATGLGWEHFTMERLEFYGKVSFIRGGIVDADMVTTVSDRYSKEIQTKEFGCGLEGVLAKRREHLTGIINGINFEEWDPEKDADIPFPYNAKNVTQKSKNKAALQKENELEIKANTPLLGIVSRLVDQKGLDILIPSLESIFQMGIQVVLLGTGDEKYHKVLRDMAKKNKEHCGFHILFDPKMAKRIYAGADMILYSSYYEPCGLGQMISLRFGAVPVVRATGGFVDTIEEFQPTTLKGNGFIFEDYSSEALLAAVGRALDTYREPRLWKRLVQNAMACDFSWSASAKQYAALYQRTQRRAIQGLGK
ncbi:MAG: glycogen synthase GlgA [Candidatus Omnitrophica bacterium]|nr:glycogen synthase GlgA [Candidatus Omnitrophota bacterium]